MKRQRTDDLAAEIARLRGAGPLPEKHRERAAEVAKLWMEQDARWAILRDAPPGVASAMQREYVVTGLLPENLRVFDNGYRIDEVVNG